MLEEVMLLHDPITEFDPREAEINENHSAGK
jgi:hypothetical protein